MLPKRKLKGAENLKVLSFVDCLNAIVSQHPYEVRSTGKAWERILVRDQVGEGHAFFDAM